jgi:hypothetical protein
MVFPVAGPGADQSPRDAGTQPDLQGTARQFMEFLELQNDVSRLEEAGLAAADADYLNQDPGSAVKDLNVYLKGESYRTRGTSSELGEAREDVGKIKPEARPGCSSSLGDLCKLAPVPINESSRAIVTDNGVTVDLGWAPGAVSVEIRPDPHKPGSLLVQEIDPDKDRVFKGHEFSAPLFGRDQHTGALLPVEYSIDHLNGGMLPGNAGFIKFFGTRDKPDGALIVTNDNAISVKFLPEGKIEMRKFDRRGDEYFDSHPAGRHQEQSAP